MSLGKEQYGKSVAELERYRTESWDELTSILVRFDDQENQRRIVEENNRLDRWGTPGVWGWCFKETKKWGVWWLLWFYGLVRCFVCCGTVIVCCGLRKPMFIVDICWYMFITSWLVWSSCARVEASHLTTVWRTSGSLNCRCENLRYEALQIEAVTSGRKNAAIEMKWADLLNMDIPQELNDQLQFQKSACRQIIDSKDRRIEDFKTELKNKDEESWVCFPGDVFIVRY